MKKLTSLLSTICLFVFVSSCTLFRGDEVSPRGEETKDFALTDFENVNGGNAIFYTVKKGSKFSITATGDGRDIDDLDVRVKDKTLKIDYVNRFGKIVRYRMDVVIEMPTVKQIEFSGASDALFEDFSGLKKLNVKISGASKLRIREKMEELIADVNGASTLTVTNIVAILDASISGASTVNAFDADASEAYIKASGASTARVTVSDYLEVDASGASSVFYRGTPEIKEKTSGASKVKKE